MSLSVFLGIDVGTTAIKLGVIEENQLLYTNDHPIETSGDEIVKYQDANQILTVLQEGLMTIPLELRRRITKLGISTAMHSLMPEDDSGQIFIWSDLQAAGVIEQFKQVKKATAKHFYQLTGTPIHAMSPFAKLLYFQQAEKYPAGLHWSGLKEVLMKYFTGETVLDYSTASATGLFDLRKKQWSHEILTYLGMHEEQLARLVDTNQTFALLPSVAELFGFSSELQVVIGASDGTLAAYASYYATGRRASLTIGTSGAVRQITTDNQLDADKQNFCYYLNGELKVSGAPSNNGGIILAWAAQQLAVDPLDFYASVPNLLMETKIGSNGLRFWPYLNGERAPYWDNEIKGGFYDLTLQHTRSDLLRSVIEGVLLNIRRLVQLVAKNEDLSVSGGFFQTPALAQLAATVFGTVCYYAPENEPIFGLYYLLEQPELVKKEQQQVFFPDSLQQAAYQHLAEHYFD
ncbi:gluconokinase [Enterococcus devriesei]|uniref:gluconokinase n=1 Tax=Enterococcus devriesei TaxID=319970 RepID=UPI0009FBD97C|nr:FGGY family carbohydrate kinase [Enterococcus devriesei]